ncbi:helix-turn-helix domain-containing protein [[Kitasatospora] papulosa]|uniref:helix-turn-helix domain-containing protein n=1 Tax=[Kitasatospora] papulosa TaxID=1464011 RepID=UPI00369BF245
MCTTDTRKRALAPVAQGFSQNSVSKQTGISRAAIRSWLQRIEPLGHKPGLIDACVKAVHRARPVNKVCRVQSQGCQYVTGFSKHWPCFFPQHGPGKKHERKIALETWQQQIVDAHPWDFIRGLIHSDGCRVINWATRLVGGERKGYEYPRYFFTNKSDDIRKLFSDTLTAVGVEWITLARGSGPWNISVARRASVALMDAHVGPKY